MVHVLAPYILPQAAGLVIEGSNALLQLLDLHQQIITCKIIVTCGSESAYLRALCLTGVCPALLQQQLLVEVAALLTCPAEVTGFKKS